MSKKKHLTPEQKMIIVRELLENQTTISQLSEKHGIHPNDVYNWKKKLFESANEIFSPKTKAIHSSNDEKLKKLEEKLNQREKIIAELAQENILLKKSIDGEI